MDVTTREPIKQGTVLVTGATMGIGAAIAERMAREGMDLVLVARDGARLEAAAKRLRADHGVEVLAVPLDLSREQASVRLAERLRDERIEVEILVNNAGTALAAAVAATDPARVRALVDLNAGAVVELTSLLLPGMIARGHGAIVNIASTAAYAPAPYNAAYGASKAFVLSFTRALWAETLGTGVRVAAVSPGATETPMNTRQAPGKRQPEQVAETVIKALRGRGPAVVDGRFNSVQAFVFGRLLPTRTAARITGQFFRKAVWEN
ncbi:SDR family NAD(P)-dependent oxidoreductase [Actinospica sp. MGRD01-02]|uniref:SDR family NAD(P)-dependent oxidoreductase n=1 Tax=Actinospica acidithermotolerans TaxID=2828514 RepID=A0A941ED69_9ACTN|nr:SDR family NAD(P)-dependent oxidoreductase [Actinospica acidithermotolerans]MBR7828322.1 SDR family NAD(P)-dependent oxidoreductase [Actinospica acidithermotolerans]